MSPCGPLRHLHRHHLGHGHHGPRHGHGLKRGHGHHKKFHGHSQHHMVHGHRHGHGKMRFHGKFLRDLLPRGEECDREAGPPCGHTRPMHHEHSGPHDFHRGSQGSYQHPQEQQGSGNPHHVAEEPHDGHRRHHHGFCGPHRGHGGRQQGHGRLHRGPHLHGEFFGCRFQQPGEDSQEVNPESENCADVPSRRRMRHRELFKILQEFLRERPCCEQHSTGNRAASAPPNVNDRPTESDEALDPAVVLEQATETQGK